MKTIGVSVRGKRMVDGQAFDKKESCTHHTISGEKREWPFRRGT